MNMLPRLITSRCLNATRGGIATSSLVLAASLAHPASGLSPRGAGIAGAHSALRPGPDTPRSPAETMRAYQVVDGWVRSWSIPDEAPALGELKTGGVSIVLRLGGEVIGRGAVFADDGAGGDANGLPAAETLRRAARLAISEAEHRLAFDNDALRDQRVRMTAREMLISLEVSGPLVPIEPATFDDIERDLSPGLDGVAVRVGQNLAGTFPGTLLSSNTTLRLAYSRAASQAGGEPTMGLDEPNILRDRHEARFYRFRVTHLAQCAADGPPKFLVRGARFINVAEITSSELRAMADRAASHLLTREWTDDGAYGMHGLYEPWTNRYNPVVAGPIEQLTAAYALRVYAGTTGVNPQQALAARSLAARVLRALRNVEPDETAAGDSPVSSALWVVVDAMVPPVAGSGDSPDSGAAPEDCRRVVLSSFNKLDGFAGTIPVPARGLLAYALVELAAREPAGGLRAEALGLAEAAVRRAYRDTPDGLLISQMPWLGFAERRLAELRPIADGASGEIPAAVALRQMRSDLWEHQVELTDPAANEALGGAPDIVGGIVFTGALAGRTGTDDASPTNVTWQSAQALAFLPAMLTDDRLTPAEERPLQLARLLTSLRFIRQLQIDDSALWMIPAPRRALGGVRVALWDLRMSGDATAMSLLAIAESLRAIDAMHRR